MDPKEKSKLDKKAAKALAKSEKKQARAADGAVARGGASGSVGVPSPAERSAAAAERQVALQRYRVLLAALMLLSLFVAGLPTT